MMTSSIGHEYLAELKRRAMAAQSAGRLAEAEALWASLYRGTQEAVGRLDASLPSILLQAANVAMERHKHAASCDYADRALQLLDEIADANNEPVDRETRLQALTQFAASSRVLGRLQDAELTLQIALMEAEFSLGEDHHQVTAAWTELALVYQAMNQPQEADRVWRRAMEASARAQITQMTWPGVRAFNPAA